ncbi:leucyl aminopeptidase family protein [Lichenihabitans sp. PAMC28606]|uniref:leucyl aminopeptidase family protein n=1 Tax=Lichenihabitans sp. PAMC28606 TaxID=2880932 RepID=UPI001D0AA79D|nr:leucyl aminopeptidase family protein [Lichenihabitans sp. PAMC28606]UDL96101.1 leucyl aminopeptidase family protein [Lichenihabitans sp. PAMC28606]
MPASFVAPDPDAIPIHAVMADKWPAFADALEPIERSFAEALGFTAKPGSHLIVPGADGAIGRVLYGRVDATARGFDAFAAGRLSTLLPAGRYQLVGGWPDPGLTALGWALSAYRFTRYKSRTDDGPLLCVPTGTDGARLQRIVEAVALARDLVNTPANDLGPEALEAAAVALATRHGAEVRVFSGDMLRTGFPLVHAVGQAAAEHPRLVDFAWGPMDAPKVTLVGKGVTFDTGGLDIKPESGMALMKKDMGGAATALALAHMVMDAGLKIRLRVIVPIVENAISSSAFRPGDVYRSRKGPTVEIGNTDAEGRLILADALALACEESPVLLFDFATLTGAARVALGPDLPPFYTDDDALADEIARCGKAAHDPVWRMPLWAPYDALLEGKTGEINNISGGPFAGSVTAALFLRRFVEPDTAWVHFDIFGWNPTTKPGRPEGGETQTARLLFDLLSARYPA